MIRHHHERYDGRGYPDGLRGDDIPYEVRLLSIVDAYDALTSHRSYRPAPLSHTRGAGNASPRSRRRQMGPGDGRSVRQRCWARTARIGKRSRSRCRRCIRREHAIGRSPRDCLSWRR